MKAFLVFLFLINIIHAKKIKVGIYNNPPALFLNEQNQAAGFWPDLINELAKKHHWDVEYVFDSWTNNVDKVKTGQIDLLPSVEFSNERSNYMDYSKHYGYKAWGQLYSNPNANLKSFLALKDKKIGLVKNDIFASKFTSLMKSFHINFEQVEFDDSAMATQELSKHKIDGFVSNNIYGYRLEKNHKIQKSSIVFAPFYLHAVAPKNQYKSHLIHLDSFLEESKANPKSKYHALVSKWLSSKTWYSIYLPKWLINLFIFLLIILVAFFLWTKTLKTQIASKTKNFSHALALLSESEAKFRSFFEMEMVGVAICDKNLHVIKHNQSYTEMLGKQFSKNHIFLSHFDELEQTKLKTSIKHLMKNKETSAYYETYFTNKNNKQFHINLCIKKLPVKNPLDCQFILLFTDLNAKVTTENEVVKAIKKLDAKSKELEEIIYATSHDFRSPLVNIQGFCYELDYDLKDIQELFQTEFDKESNKKLEEFIQSTAQPILNNLKKSTNDFSNVLEGLIKIARSGRHHLEPVSFDVNQMLEQLIISTPHFHNHCSKIHIQTGLPSCFADEKLVLEVFYNLIDNSLLHSNNTKELVINITGYDDEKWSCYEIKDNAQGIEQSKLDVIFQPSFSHENSEIKLGVGLCVSHIIVNNHGGHLILESDSEGTILKFRFPKVYKNPENYLSDTINNLSQGIRYV
jgi:signal transduction histidine kinase/ABC-type amino acid transport substrate-binding protein